VPLFLSAAKEGENMGVKRLLHAGRAAISYNGKVIGYMTNVSPSEDWGLAPQYAIGSIFAIEIPALRFLGTVTAGLLVIEKQKARDCGIPAGEDEASLNEAIRDLLTKEGVDITVTDIPTGDVVLSITGCKCGTQNWTITANAVITRNATFQFRKPMKEGSVRETTDGYVLPQPAST
jgi:hypothetical protein